MKKILLFLALILLLPGASFGETRLADYQLYPYIAIKDVAITSANTLYPLTFDAGSVVSLNIQAVGGDINMSVTPSMSDPAWVIPKGMTFFDHLPLPLAINTTLYFYSATAGTTVESLYMYRQ